MLSCLGPCMSCHIGSSLPTSRGLFCVPVCCLLHPSTGIHNLVFKVPASSLQTPVPHLFKQPKGLSELSVMQQWMAEEPASNRDGSSARGKAEEDGQAPGLPKGRVTVMITTCGSDADMAACKDQLGMVAGA